MALGDFSSKGRIVILGQIVLASGQIFRSDFRPQDEIFRPGMPFRPLDEQALDEILEDVLNLFQKNRRPCGQVFWGFFWYSYSIIQELWSYFGNMAGKKWKKNMHCHCFCL